MPFNIGPIELAVMLVLSGAPSSRWSRGSSGSSPVRDVAPPGPPPADLRAVLAERLARGKITPDEFDTAMQALGYGGSEG